MKVRIVKWHRLLALSALVVVTTGITAAPLRKSLAPVLENPLGSWSIRKPAAQVARPQAAQVSRLASARNDESAFASGTVASGRLVDSVIASKGVGPFELGIVSPEHGAAAYSVGDRGGRKSREWKFGNSRSSAGGRWGNIGGGGFGGARFGRSGGATGPGNAGAGGGSGSGVGSGGGSGRNDRDDSIFNEHKSGFPELTGKKPGHGPGGTVVGSGPTLAHNPEPSTLILFGTGLATALGTIRRRLRRQ
jgi:hypothetical protein